jgi:hypothetical protein
LSDVSDYVLRRVRDHIKARRSIIDAAFPKHLKKKAYAKLVGQHEEIRLLEALVQDAVRKANGGEVTELVEQTDDPPEPEPAVAPRVNPRRAAASRNG